VQIDSTADEEGMDLLNRFRETRKKRDSGGSSWKELLDSGRKY
jgi:hypothetical protein